MLKLTERLGPIEASQADDTLTLPYELRIRGRLKAESDSGRELGLFLDRGPVLRDGEGLRAETGEVVRLQAAVEPVVTARVAAGLPLARLAYHLGNRHVQLALGEDEEGSYVRFPPDHVLEELATLLGAALVHHEAPFDPESGAYHQPGHGHSHAHDHDHSHGHHHHEHSHAH
ncbi:MAG: urease accessory protein UreE [Halomonas sp.]|uniref:urease accessory protein UreE n=1 Tax=Halomonas sp. TaxID=1486246 RepID=UPI002ACD7063|nr:urease accessory protein UreE [Halomonas sp.]MDZ7853100.1 urease accessory protein UreE [Halomonas sp.]